MLLFVSHSAIHSKCQMINTVNSGRRQTLKQCTSYNRIHSSSNSNPAVERQFNIRLWSKWLLKSSDVDAHKSR